MQENLEQVENIFIKLKNSMITEETANTMLNEKVSKLNKEEANILMKKLNKYQYEDRLRKTVYEISSIVYDLIKDCDD